MALVSATTLRHWNTEIEIIFVVSDSWVLAVPDHLEPFKILEVTPVFDEFPFDKSLLSKVDSYPSIIYLDADTLVLDDVERIREFSGSDVSARLAWVYQQSGKWNRDYEHLWLSTIARAGVEYIPVLNSGVVLFNNFAHVRVGPPWEKYMRRFLSCDLPHVYGSRRHYEQLGLALAISEMSFSVDLMKRDLHGFGWVPESYNCVVYHTSSRRYEDQISGILGERELSSINESTRELLQLA